MTMPARRPMKIWVVMPGMRDRRTGTGGAWVVSGLMVMRIGLSFEGEKLSDRLHHVALLRLGQLAVDRQRERFPGRLLRVREIPFPIAERREALLPMERHRVVDLGADFPRLEVREQPVAQRRDVRLRLRLRRDVVRD